MLSREGLPDDRPNHHAPAWLLLVLAALVWWLVGFLPAIVHGGSLPVPMAATGAPALVEMALVGGAAAGLLALLHRGPAGIFAVAAGAVLAACVLVPLSRDETPADGSWTDSRVLEVLVVVGVAATFLGVLCGLLAVAGPRWLRAPAAVVPGLVVIGWLHRLLPSQPDGAWWLHGVLALCLGVSIGLAATPDLPGLVGGVLALPVAWTVQSGLTAFAMVGSRVGPGARPQDLAGDGLAIFSASWGEASAHLPAGFVAGVVLAALLLVVRWRVGRRRPAAVAIQETGAHA